MNETLYYVGWEAINISIEYTAASWARLPRLFLAVAAVNLLTHPLFTHILKVFGNLYGRGLPFLTVCEAVVFIVEWLVLCVFYGSRRWRITGVVALAMNAASFGCGILIGGVQ